MGLNARIPLACSLLLALCACGNFIELAPPREDVSPTVDAGPAPAPGSDAAVARGFYATCADALSQPSAVSEDAYGGLLSQHVQTGTDGFALVDYVGWSQAAPDMAALGAHLAEVATASPGACDLAFWINAYNALVLRGVLDTFGGDTGYSVSDDDFAFFKSTRYPVAGMMLSLDELEHGVVRGDWLHGSVDGSPSIDQLMAAHTQLWNGEAVDARIHMALNCAARGCPNLGDVPYTGDSLDAQLEAATRAFLANGDKGAGPSGITQLFDWFRPDFETDSGSVDDFIRLHRPGGLSDVDSGRFIPYDWTLNSL